MPGFVVGYGALGWPRAWVASPSWSPSSQGLMGAWAHVLRHVGGGGVQRRHVGGGSVQRRHVGGGSVQRVQHDHVGGRGVQHRHVGGSRVQCVQRSHVGRSHVHLFPAGAVGPRVIGAGCVAVSPIPRGRGRHRPVWGPGSLRPRTDGALAAGEHGDLGPAGSRLETSSAARGQVPGGGREPGQAAWGPGSIGELLPGEGWALWA